MPATRPRAFPQRLARRLIVVASLLVASACSAGPSGTSSAAPSEADEATWRGLAGARVAPLAGAVRVSVGQIDLVDENPWGLDASVETPVALSELIAAGLLRRPDVHFVERRRFAAAVDAERRGETRPRGAPRAGVSPRPELVVSVTWASYGATSAYLEGRLTDPDNGQIRRTWRTETPADADLVGIARAVVGGLVAELERMDRAPAWDDPLESAAPSTFRPTNIPLSAVNSFLAGLASEEVWDWEGARVGYQSASAEDESFFEAEVVLARAARLRSGGTLGSG